jgi:hypothetical protein
MIKFLYFSKDYKHFDFLKLSLSHNSHCIKKNQLLVDLLIMVGYNIFIVADNFLHTVDSWTFKPSLVGHTSHIMSSNLFFITNIHYNIIFVTNHA